MASSLRNRLARVESALPPPPGFDYEAPVARLHADIASEFGITVGHVWSKAEPLAWLHRCCDGAASPDELALFARLTSVAYFEGGDFSTEDYLRAVSKWHRMY